MIKSLSDKGVYHCDIKGNNIIVDAEGNLLFIDFGSIVF
jgi:serine/threonine protein kinase